MKAFHLLCTIAALLVANWGLSSIGASVNAYWADSYCGVRLGERFEKLSSKLGTMGADSPVQYVTVSVMKRRFHDESHRSF
jgi:hypothetical protein